MSYIFNMNDFRLSPLLQEFPYFDICWTRIPVMSYIFNMIDFRLSPLLQDFPYFDICWTRIPVIPSMKQNIYWGSMALEWAIYST